MLCQLQNELKRYGKELSSYGLPQLDPDFDVALHEFREEDSMHDGLDVASIESMLMTLTPTQRELADKVFSAISNGSQLLLFVDAPGGTGKTYTLNVILKKLKVNGHSVVPVATSALAATILEGGRTAHSAFKIPINLDENATSWITYQSSEAEALRACQLILWMKPQWHTKICFCVWTGY